MSSARRKLHEEQEIVRWGDQQQISVSLGSFNSNQLVRVARAQPETFTLVLFAEFEQFPSPFFAAVTFFVIVGAGAAQVQLNPSITLNSALLTDIFTPNYIQTGARTAFLTLELACKDLQVQAQIVTTINGVMQIGAFAAPRFNPRSARGHVEVPEVAPAPDGGDGSGGTPGASGSADHEWMPPGFYPVPVTYP